MKKFLPWIDLFLLLALVGGISFFTLRSCHPSPTEIVFPSPSPAIKAHAIITTSQTATQSIKITIRRPSATNTPKPTQHSGQQAGNTHMPYVIAPETSEQGLTGQQEGLSEEQPQSDEITIEIGQSVDSGAVSDASASIEAPKITQNAYSSIGIIAGTLPGCVALDYRAIHLGPIGLDLAGNHRAIGAGLSVGEKFFGLAGGYQAFDGGRGLMSGAGVRF